MNEVPRIRVDEYKKFIGEPVAETTGGGLNIKVLGPGCPRCAKPEQDVRSVLAETSIDADLEHVSNPAEIGRFGVLGTPAPVIDGEDKAVGSVPLKAKLKGWIEQAADRKG